MKKVIACLLAIALLGSSLLSLTSCAPIVSTLVKSAVDGESPLNKIGLCNHSYVEEITVAATCNGSGTKTYTCSLCGAGYTESYEVSSHTATEIHDMYAVSICEILTYNKNGQELGIGSGFVYSSDGKIVTNYHVLENAYSIKVTLDGQSYNVMNVLAYDKDIDLAILEIAATNLKSVTICNKTHDVGAEVYAFGSSKGLTATFSRGIVTYADRELDGVVYTQHDAAISAGNSGGPLINQYGEVIGVNTLSVKDSQNLNFAINVSELSNLNYGEKLTVAEFYDKECNAVQKMKNYIVSKGTYSSSGNSYVLDLGYFYLSDYSSKCTRYALYDIDDGAITLAMITTEGSLVCFKITDLDGVYDWAYTDDYGYTMGGVINASTYTSDTLLGYSYNNLPTTSLTSTVRNLSSVMMSVLLLYIDSDFADAGVKAEDLGFVNY